ncbi:MAG: MBL fold metallo-hydrolase [Nannocystaceae bacterium]|nr:MBL fold metallo-hydrolase [Nannocystaceae bacterium]
MSDRAGLVLWALLGCGALGGCAQGGMEGYRSRLQAPAESASSGVRVTWMGTAGVSIDDGQTALLIDPFVSRNRGAGAILLRARLHPDQPRVARWANALAPTRTKAVLVSHSHFDHAMDAPFFAQRTHALLVGSNSTGWIGQGAGLAAEQIRVVSDGSVVRFGDFKVTFLESQHGTNPFGGTIPRKDIKEPVVPPSRHADYDLGATFSIVIEHPLGTIVHHASASLRPAMFEAADVRADVVLLGIAGRSDTEQYLQDVVDALGAPVVIPIHFDNFFEPLDTPMEPLPTVDLDEFWATADAHQPRLDVRTLPLGEPVIVLKAGPDLGDGGSL